MRPMRFFCLLVALLSSLPGAMAADGNRLAYLDAFCDPYYVGRETARLVTPQWIGEQGVEAAAVLSIDDLKDPQVHETFLRPIIERLKQIDGRGPVSCMGNKIDVGLPIFQQWLQEGVSVEAHTYDHPCPCLQGDDFAKAKGTYDEGVDLINTVPNTSPVAFRMPCCDSMNSMSPRFYTEVFNKTTPKGHFLQVNSSVFLLFTPDDPDLPPAIVRDEQGKLRFDKYVPRDREFVNYVEDYPYPYVVARLCWELPSAMPDDWQGFNLLGAHHPVMAADMRAALDATVIQQGLYTLCHHAGRWIRSDQVVDLVDHAVEKYGNKVKFLNFREVNERLTKNLLGGVPLRAANGQDNGVRIADLNADGFMDVVIGNETVRQTRLWSPEKQEWILGDFPAAIVRVDAEGNRRDAGLRFGVLQKNGFASILVRNDEQAGAWHFDGKAWIADDRGLSGLEIDGPLATSRNGQDQGIRLCDLDRDGTCELIAGGPGKQAVFAWSDKGTAWNKLPFTLPEGASIVDPQGRDAGLRLVDLNGDDRLDLVFSNAERYLLHLYVSPAEGWSKKVRSGKQGQADSIPMIVRADGTNNGAWFKYGHMWVQNEETGGREKPSQAVKRPYALLINSH
ncbi:MAG: hypothetical protein ACYC6Y_13480 [Thermoguttaceae bacterium]